MTITNEDVARVVREWIEVGNAMDFQRQSELEPAAFGFGYRTVAVRQTSGQSGQELRAAFERWKESLASYRLELDTVETAVFGDVGLAWGWYTEDFQHKGQPPERARVRFTKTLLRDADGWKVILYHRDIQPFEADGRYPRSLTLVEPPNG